MPVTPRRLVLVPGMGLDERSSAALRARAGGAVIALPGMGRPGEVPSLEELAAELTARLGAGPVLLVGHSQSCQVVAAAAGDPRVRAIVLIGPTTDPRLRSPLGLGWHWLATAAAEPVRHLPLVLRQWRRTGPRAMRSLWTSAAPDHIGDRLARSVVPVTVVRGSRDRLCPRDWATTLAHAAPRGRLVEIPGAAHLVVQTHPDEVAAVLRDASGPDHPGR